jgi:hypothetical protein
MVLIPTIYSLAFLFLTAGPTAAAPDSYKTAVAPPPTAQAGDTAQTDSQGNSPVAAEKADETSDYTILSSDATGITFVYRPQMPRAGKLAKPRLDRLPDIPRCTWEDEAGRPLLPRRIFHIAVPTGYSPRVSVKTYQGQMLGRFAVPRAPAYEVVEIDGIKTYKAIPAAQVLPSRPEAAILLSFGIARGLGVANVAVYPLDLDEMGLLYAKAKITVRVDFVPDAKMPRLNTALALPRDDEQGLLANIINYKQIAQYCPVRGEVRMQQDNSPVFTPRDIPLPAYKIYVKEQGMVRISGAWLKNNGIDLNGINPENIKIYGSDGDTLPMDNAFAPKSVSELAVDMHDGGDGRFDPDDWFAFYGFGTYYLDDSQNWHRDRYTEYNVYWLSLGGGSGRRMALRDVTPDQSAPAASFRDRAFGEQDLSFWGNNGSLNEGDDSFYWGYSAVGGGLQDIKNFAVPTPGSSGSGTAHLSGQICGISYSSIHHSKIYINDHLVYDQMWYGADNFNAEIDFPGSYLTSETTTVKVYEENGSPTQVDNVLYNYFRITYDSRYEARGDSLLFLPPNTQPGSKTYLVTNITTPGVSLYEVNTGEVLVNFTNTALGSVHNIRFTDPVGGARRYAAVGTGRFITPVGMKAERSVRLPSDATGADIIYIVHPRYAGRLDPLISYRRSQGFRVEQVFVDDIYDEYSAGLMDPTAIRNFLYHAYTHWQGTPPGMVGLVGDCNWDFREIINRNAHDDLYCDFGWNEVPTHYEFIGNSDGETAADNWFVCFDGHSDILPEMAITRISPDTPAELDHMVTKFISYEQTPTLGDWTMSNTYVADNNDPNGPGAFTSDAQSFFSDTMPFGQTARKMYLESLGFPDEWLQDESHVSDRMNMTRTQFTPMLLTHFNSLILQYGGHGAHQLWAHEKMLWERIGTSGPDIVDIENMTNRTELPLVIMLSCSTCRFDEPPEVPNVVGSGDSLGEYFTRISEHGGIAAMGSTRLSNESSLRNYVDLFYYVAFPDRNLPTNPMTLSEAFRTAKVLESSITLNEEFVLMGDPGTTLRIPRQNVTLTPNASTVARGGLLNVSGTMNTAFTGTAEVFLEDTVHYYESEEVYPHSIFKPRRIAVARASVQNGRFNATLPLPTNAAPLSDQTQGVVRAYAWNDQTKMDGCNRVEVPFDIQGTLPSNDHDGPQIAIGLVDGPFRDGDTVATSSRFRVRLNDPSGMMIAVEGDPLNPTSHPINAIINGPYNISIDCTPLYVPDVDNYQNGSVEFSLFLKPGNYTLTMVATDSRGNESQKSVTFNVGSGLLISNPLVCPNPVVEQSYFTFNLSNYATSGKVNIYTVTGRLVRSLETHVLRAGYNEVEWDGRDSRGNRLANGCYFYVLTVRDGNNKDTVKGKFLVMR